MLGHNLRAQALHGDIPQQQREVGPAVRYCRVLQGTSAAAVPMKLRLHRPAGSLVVVGSMVLLGMVPVADVIRQAAMCLWLCGNGISMPAGAEAAVAVRSGDTQVVPGRKV